MTYAMPVQCSTNPNFKYTDISFIGFFHRKTHKIDLFPTVWLHSSVGSYGLKHTNIYIERFSIECRKQLVNSFGFALLHSVIGSKFSRHFFNQSKLKPKPIVARACTFSGALCRLRVITSSFDWFTGLSPSFLIGHSNYFAFGFTL